MIIPGEYSGQSSMASGMPTRVVIPVVSPAPETSSQKRISVVSYGKTQVSKVF
jgi:hypothetical protein